MELYKLNTEQDKKDATEFLPDIETLLKIFSDLKGNMSSDAGREFCEGLTPAIITVLKQLKAGIMIELDLI